ncbi:MAG: PTS fructose transporter subunit IIBC [Tissierellia bacterium]|nr:PTS fructose transporter subunit IIBC [Tissierellia bacterium]
MIGVILTAHGNYASGVYSGLELITGGSENVRVLDFTEDSTPTYEDELKKLIDQTLEEYDQLVIATDLAGGTPFNKSVMLSQSKNNVTVCAGLNFQLAYELAFSTEDLDNSVENAMNSAKEGIVKFENPEQKEDEEDLFEDGI